MGTQKHGVLYVPDYTTAGDGVSPLSYLALGRYDAMHTHLTSARRRGDDLVVEAGYQLDTTNYSGGAVFFDDDQRVSQGAGGTASATQTHTDGDTAIASTSATYHRYASGPIAGDTTTQSDRATLTGELLQRGGWRDHTDGNRILTVRGDRVDVVLGNYKRIVFGRVKPITGAIGASSWEVSGGHIFQGTSTGIASMHSVEWVEESHSTDDSDTPTKYWKVVETTEQGDTFVRYSGRVEEYYNGPRITSTTGAADGGATKNPHMKEVNWIQTKTSQTTADDITDNTDADEIDSETVCEGHTSTVEQCLTKTDTVGYGRGTPPVKFDKGLWTVLQFNFDTFAGSLGLSLGGYTSATAGHSVNVVGGFSFGLAAIALELDLYMGTKTSIRIGPSQSFFAGNQFALNVLGPLEIILKKIKANATESKAQVMKVECKGTKVELGALKSRLFAFQNKT